QDRAFTVGEVAGQALLVPFPQRRRDDELGQRPAQDLGPAVAEDGLGGGGELDDPAPVVHRDDAVQRRLPGPRLAGLPLPCRPAPPRTPGPHRPASPRPRNTSTPPERAPPSPRIGAPESSIGTSRPSRVMRRVWFASPTIAPSRRTLLTGFSTGWRLSSLMM